MWRVNNMLLKDPWVKNKSKMKSENTLKQIKMETQLSKTYAVQQNQI